MITLFAAPPRSSGFPFTSIASVLLHISLFGLITHKVVTTHRVIERLPLDRYSVHLLEFHSTEPKTHKTAGGVTYSGPKKNTPAHPQDTPQPTVAKVAPASGAAPAVTRQTARLLPAPQTLVQPDLPKNVVIPDKTPIPLVALWSAMKVPTPKIVPPLPRTPSIAVVQPSIETPIAEEKLADLKLSSTAVKTPLPMPPPSTTSPIVVHGPEDTKKVPETSSKQAETPTPARVLSLSDVRVPDGKVAVPAANQSAKSPPGAMVPGVLKSTALNGNGDAQGKTGQTGSGKATGDHPNAKGENSGAEKTAAAGIHSGDPTAAPGQVAAQTGTVARDADGSAFGQDASIISKAVHLSLPKDGQFGAVIVGGSIEERYPETAELWSGRLASTVYLHVGLSKSWILQYALPRLAPAALAGGGHVESPWPFEIVRPNLDTANLDSDALILHGFVNKDGKFEKLEVVFPPQFTQAQMVVKVLNQWQFRPAKQDGNYIPVEILLIIPDQLDQ
jgi:hypothetical protein